VRPRRSQLGYVLLDARSRHGTRVNGRPAHKAAIGLGDAIRIGPFELEVIETPAGQYAVPPKLPAAGRPARFELVPRGWRTEAWPLLPGSATVIGRGRACHITVQDRSVSACHCVLCLDPADDGRMPFVIDLHSRNGTYVSRRAIHRKHLLPGDALIVGDVRLKLRRLKVEEPAPPELEVEIAPAPPRTRAAAAEPASPGEAVEPAPPLVETILFATDEAEEVAAEAVAREAAAPAPHEEVLTEADLDRMLADEPEAPAAEAPTAEEAAEAVPDEPIEAAVEEAPPAPEPAAAAAEDTKACEVVALPQPAVSAASPERLLAAGPDDYGEFFGFGHPPFGLTPDPDCFFDSQAHWDALDTLVGWLKSGPPVAVLFGDMGSGKTLVVECLARRLAYRRPAAVVSAPPRTSIPFAGGTARWSSSTAREGSWPCWWTTRTEAPTRVCGVWPSCSTGRPRGAWCGCCWLATTACASWWPSRRWPIIWAPRATSLPSTQTRWPGISRTASATRRDAASCRSRGVRSSASPSTPAACPR